MQITIKSRRDDSCQEFHDINIGILRFLKFHTFQIFLNKMNISKKEKIDLLMEQIRQMQNVLSLLQEEQGDNLVRCKIFIFYFKNEIYYNIFFYLSLIHLKPLLIRLQLLQLVILKQNLFYS